MSLSTYADRIEVLLHDLTGYLGESRGAINHPVTQKLAQVVVDMRDEMADLQRKGQSDG